jgi:hypothetical protein
VAAVESVVAAAACSSAAAASVVAVAVVMLLAAVACPCYSEGLQSAATSLPKQGSLLQLL